MEHTVQSSKKSTSNCFRGQELRPYHGTGPAPVPGTHRQGEDKLARTSCRGQRQQETNFPAHSLTVLCLQGSDDWVNRAEGAQRKKEAFLLGKSSHLNCCGGGFLWLVVSRNKGILGRGISGIECESMLKARDGVQGAMMKMKKEGKWDGKTGQGSTVKGRLKSLNFSLQVMQTFLYERRNERFYKEK